MIWYQLSFLFGFIVTAGIGFAVFIHHPKRRTNQYWGFLCLSVALWNCGRFMRLIASSSADYDSGLFWCRVMYMGAILIPVFFYFFIHHLLDRKSSRGYILFIPTIIFIVSNFSSLLIKDIVMQFSQLYYPVPGILYKFFLLYFLGYVIAAHYHLFRFYSRSKGYKRRQLQYVVLASIVGFLSGLTTFPLVFNIQIPPLGAPLVSIYTLIITYAIVRYRLMDIRIILKVTLTYTLLILLTIIPCYLLIMFAMHRFLGIEHPGGWFQILLVSIMLLLSFVVPKVKVKTEKTIEQTLFSTQYDFLQTIRQTSQDIVSILHLPELLEKLTDTLQRTFSITNSAILLLDPELRKYTLAQSRNFGEDDTANLSFPEDERFFQLLNQQRKILVLEELELSYRRRMYTSTMEFLRNLKAEVCIPIQSKKRLVGVITLGKKQNGEMFTDEDLKILSTMANQVAIVIENAMLYKKMLRTDRLAVVGTMAARLAHEIRNPLVSIKTVTELLPERIDDPEFRDHFLKIAIKEINRIKLLLDDLLNYAKRSTPRFQITNIIQILSDMVLIVKSETRSKNIQINFLNHDNFPEIMIDPDQMKQVFLNVLLNATQACEDNGHIKISTTVIEKDPYQQYAQVSISDDGIGIPEEDIENLFNPFFTTKIGGIGLGLSTTHQIVQEHNGYIEVDSKTNVGTVFYINLPLNQSNAKDIAL